MTSASRCRVTLCAIPQPNTRGPPVRSELVYLLVGLDKEYTASAPDQPSESFSRGTNRLACAGSRSTCPREMAAIGTEPTREGPACFPTGYFGRCATALAFLTPDMPEFHGLR